jgi:hypothetical protein
MYSTFYKFSIRLLSAFFLSVTLFSDTSQILSVDLNTRSRADSLLKKKDFQSAFRLSNEIIKNSPSDPFGWWLKLQATSKLAASKGAWPRECLEAAYQLVNLEPANEAVHFNTAIWCLNHEKNYKEIASLKDRVIPAARESIGNDNYALLINLISFSFMKLDEYQNARNVLKQGISDLIDQPSVFKTGYNLTELFQDDSMTIEERAEWHELFSFIIPRSNSENPLIGSIAWNTSLLTDMYVQDKNLKEAYQTISLLYPDYDQQVMSHWNFLRDQLFIKYLGLKYSTSRLKKEPKRILKMIFLVIPRTRLINQQPITLSKFGSLNSDLEEKDLQSLLTSFIYFRDSFEVISDGIRWEMSLIKTNAEIQSTNLIDQKFRYVMQPDISSIVPKLTTDVTNQIINSDAVVVVWPGTKQPNGVLITNGGGTEWNYGTDVNPEIRLTILSDSNKNKNGGNHANHPIFLYHEMFHVLEWAYHKSKFSKNDHPYMRKKEWPKDYEGSTEWDFYSETFKKRMMQEDQFDRLYWKGRKEGFYGIQERERTK